MFPLKRHRQRGFTLIELLIVVAIIGLIAAILVPNFLDSLQRGRQKRTMGDIRITGVGMVSWTTDHAGAAAAGQATINLAEWTGSASFEDIREALIPDYIQEIPEADGWAHDYTYRFALENPSQQRVMLIASPGKDGMLDGTYAYGTFPATDYDQDIIWGDGRFIRSPDK